MCSRLLAVLAVVGALLALGSGSAEANPTAAPGSAPGSFTGYGFDTCAAPPQELMDAWWTSSPYAAVGVFIGGSMRLCKDQPNLTADWVRTQRHTGWRILAAYVGPQASCSGYADKMSSDLATAHQQGVTEAVSAVAAAQGLGIGSGSTLYYDLEDYPLVDTACRQAALNFLSGWTEQLHAMGYQSGVYSNIAAAITSLDLANNVSHGSYTMPDDIWYAWANGRADAVTDARVQTHEWDDHDRVHQYRIDTPESWGGYALAKIDQNWLDVGLGSVGTPTKPLCRGVDVDLRHYPTLRPGSHGPTVAAAQCLLRKQHLLAGNPSGKYDARTVKAVKKAQRKLDQRQTGKVTRRTWVALLARGPQPLVKVGSTGDPVRRLQRALSAALGKRVTVDGAFSQATERAVKRYQRKAGLPESGVVADEVWNRLDAGR
jgi:peptidoglycan hydrolase-like protein with peptidoglycan-binding domain